MSEPLKEEEIQEDLKQSDELTDDTDLLTYADIDSVLDRDDIDHDKFNESAMKGAEKILWKDVKISPKVEPVSTKDDEEKDEEPEAVVPDLKSAEEVPVKKKEVIEDKTDKTAAAKDKTDKQTFVIDENLIKTEVDKFRETNKDNPDVAKMVQDYQGILNGVKDEVMSPKVLRNYINSQLYIKNVKPNPLDPKWQPDKKITTDPDYLAKAVEAKNKIIIDSLQRVFKSFPAEALTNPEVEKDFLRELLAEDPRAFHKYEKQRDIIEKNVDETYDKFVSLRSNWKEVARDSARVEVAKFQSILAGVNLTPEECGIPDLTINDEGYNEFLNGHGNVLFKKDGSPNENVIGFVDGDIPFIRPGSVFAELTAAFMKSVATKIAERGRQEGFSIGKNSIPEPSLSDSGVKGEKDSLEENTEFDSESDKTPEELESNFAKWSKKLFNNGKRK